MTGWLAATGIVLVLLVSAYSGLMNSSADGGGANVQITPVSEVDLVEDIETPTPTPSPQPTATATPVLNRLDCQKIKGTDYLSAEERTWYLANCVAR